MKTTITLLIFVVTTALAPAGGLVIFGNSSSTLITVNGSVMPVQSVQQYNFAVFLAPSSTVATTGVAPSFYDPVFQLPSGYNVNHPTGLGRLATPNLLDVGVLGGGYAPGDIVDFVVRGWTPSLGATWAEALGNYNHGFPLVNDWAIGSSTIGNDLVLGGGIYPASPLFGNNSYQVSGFNLITTPEPTAGLLTGLGTLVLWGFRRHKRSGWCK